MSISLVTFNALTKFVRHYTVVIMVKVFKMSSEGEYNMDDHFTCCVQHYYIVFQKLYGDNYCQSSYDRIQRVNKIWMSIPPVMFNTTILSVKNYTEVITV